MVILYINYDEQTTGAKNNENPLQFIAIRLSNSSVFKSGGATHTITNGKYTFRVWNANRESKSAKYY